ncbi:MAG TPA: ParB N-terminal domain-containing protein [Candidatus Sulfotelmatobacter sp.]|nr:ParB N-terminal domain-containing protein [Candidatus Sulfotelmatobacter sp.]
MNQEQPTITYVDIESLSEWQGNPRINEKAVPEVSASIKKFGFLQPIVVDQFNTVYAGNTRLKAARALGYKTIPVVRVEHLSEKQLRAFAIADNKTAELADWDYKKLLAGTTMEEIREIPGFDTDDMNRLNSILLKMGNVEIPKEKEKGTSKISHTCPKCNHTWTA